jgi:serine protease Do
MTYPLAVTLLLLVTTVAISQPPGKTREQKVREDRQRVESEGRWIYNDLDRGFAQARNSGKPLLVILRCVPCQECVKLDDQLVDNDPALRPLLEKFVCVRLVSTNGLDLAMFQFDTDQSFAAFLLHADGTIYGRFGTRSHRTEWASDVSLAALAKAMEGALALHEDHAKHREALTGKRGPKPLFATPEQYPSLRGKYESTLSFTGEVVKKCVHCHQIGDAHREYYRSRKETIPEEVLFPYPHPRVIGLTLDPQERATVRQVEVGSPAAEAGLRSGDEIVTLAGQPLLSVADVQWVLHLTPAAGGELVCELKRQGQTVTATLRLPASWRRAGDLSWRSSTWGLRRMATGGLVLERVPRAQRLGMGLQETGMALRVRHVGQYGPHAAAKHAGFRAGDVVVAFDGRTDLEREEDLLAHGVTQLRPGQKVTVEIVRQGKRTTLMLPMQE